jgi:hypothetical protein
MENETAMTLSPAAQAVLDAFMKGPYSNRLSVAAALRAAADQVVPEPLTQRSPCREHCIIGGAAKRIRDELLAIAVELEGAN